MWKVDFLTQGISTDFCRVLDHGNPYSHYSPDNPRASKECRGLLFHGLEEHEQNQINQFRIRRNNNPWHEFDVFVPADDDEEQDE